MLNEQADKMRLTTAPNSVDPITSNFDCLTKARTVCKNQFWKDVYASLSTCRINILSKYSAEFITVPINFEPFIIKNNDSIKQDWSQNEMINQGMESDHRF